MKLLSGDEVKRIINNVVTVIKSGDIEKLSKRSYNFLMSCSGFIAHYNVYGFRNYYENTNELRLDILNNQRYNQYNNFIVGEQNAEYYHQKRDIYNAIVCEIR